MYLVTGTFKGISAGHMPFSKKTVILRTVDRNCQYYSISVSNPITDERHLAAFTVFINDTVEMESFLN